MKYCKRETGEGFNWNIALRDYTEKDYALLKAKASDWVTCACGNLCEKIPRKSSGMPIDNQLASLGTSFYYAILRKEIELAKDILQKIEKRASELL